MKPQEAKQLIKKTFETSFNKEQFTYFIKNLLKDSYEPKPFTNTGAHLPDAFSTYIRKLERIGKYEDGEGNIIDILIVELKKEHSIAWARTTQRNFVRRYLNGSRGGELKDAALVAFYTEGAEDWRFSLIKMQYSLEKKKDDLTPAKRFSFLVGANERSHTAQKQLTGLLTKDEAPVLADIESAFNIETVTREFFEKYKDLFILINEHLEKQFDRNKVLKTELEEKHINHISFTKKLLGQIVFLYFLQKKGWLGVSKTGKWGEGDKKFLRTLLEKAIANKQSFYTDYLQHLFYDALAEEKKNAADPSYYKYLDCRIPFLNGGLFEADYDWRNITIKLPNDFFTNNNTTQEEDTGNGILDIFDRYNFTVKEDEPLEKEVAVDPEMLGKVFENLLEVKDRKSKGAFYTPREIVHYMCQESLINYLDTTLNNSPVTYQKLGTDQIDMFGNEVRKGQLSLEKVHNNQIKASRKDIELFIREGINSIEHDRAKESGLLKTMEHGLPEKIRSYAAEIDKALADIRVCDPAIGSGAFPVGIMNEIVKAREILTAYLPAKMREDRTPYELKRHCIQESIYGVDIDHSAIDVAKLRLWLSLVVDEDDFYKIKPLPNLDYKIVEGNTLIGIPDGLVKNDAAEKEMEKLKVEFFSETNSAKKALLRKKINSTIQKLLETANNFLSYIVEFDLKLYYSEVFHNKGGFDIVIGNPPYVRVQNLTYEIIDLYKKNWKTAWKRIDISTLFIELGYSLLNKKGHLCYISSNQFISTEYGRLMRKYIIQNKALKSIIDFGDLPVFDNALTYVSIFYLSKYPQVLFDYHRVHKLPFQLPTKFSSIDFFSLSEEVWSLGDNKDLAIIKKIQATTDRLDKYAKCWAGIISGNDDLLLYDIDDKINHIEKDLLLPVLRAQGCNRYALAEPSKKIFYPYKENNEKTELIDLEILKSKYPKAYSFVIENKKALKIRKDSRKTFGEKEGWYGLIRFGRLKTFNKPKIVSPGEVKENKFSLDFSGAAFSCARVFSITCEDENLDIYYLLAFLNSKLIEFYLHKNSSLKNGGYFSYSSSVIDAIPFKFNPKNQKPFNTLVNKIVEAKKHDINANTTKLEKQIDIMVYHLYNLTYQEAKIVDAELSEDDFEKYK